MRQLTRTQSELLCGLIRANQGTTKNTLSKYLHQKYKKVVETKDYIYAEGNIPIALVAHMDTVFETRSRFAEVYYDREKNVMFCPDGAGFDDKAGIFAILQIIQKGLRPHIIFTTNEERGAIGAGKLADEKCPFKDLRYIIQLDRRGATDCVFYSCDNAAFTNYVETFGFVEAIGSFSDISVICPSWGVAGVNLSIGYQDEHSTSEILFVGQMFSTIDKVINMLQEEEIPAFEYIPAKYTYWYKAVPGSKKKGKVNPDDKHCFWCNKEYLPEELIPVRMCGGDTEYFCIDCISGRVDFCNCCGEAYELNIDKNYGLCEDCYFDAVY